ncbi:hypothetical protein BDZ97DRAFT_1752598 [Flammula alnicola]|nr:hypothetical protein BDZ97DRAFT_1756986 [Flammula alnicola]KAF8972743.1 hypothetical protein BDZ97DRAFT_1752598 [Flammula alnicola]
MSYRYSDNKIALRFAVDGITDVPTATTDRSLAGPSLPANHVTVGKRQITISRGSTSLMVIFLYHHPPLLHLPSPVPIPEAPKRHWYNKTQTKPIATSYALPFIEGYELTWEGYGQEMRDKETATICRLFLVLGVAPHTAAATAACKRPRPPLTTPPHIPPYRSPSPAPRLCEGVRDTKRRAFATAFIGFSARFPPPPLCIRKHPHR